MCVHTENVSHRRDYVAGKIDYETVVRGVVKNIGFDSFVDDLSSVDSKGLNYQDCEVLVRIKKQSPDIADGVHVFFLLCRSERCRYGKTVAEKMHIHAASGVDRFISKENDQLTKHLDPQKLVLWYETSESQEESRETAGRIICNDSK